MKYRIVVWSAALVVAALTAIFVGPDAGQGFAIGFFVQYFCLEIGAFIYDRVSKQ
jgi:hypothetical protein